LIDGGRGKKEKFGGMGRNVIALSVKKRMRRGSEGKMTSRGRKKIKKAGQGGAKFPKEAKKKELLPGDMNVM